MEFFAILSLDFNKIIHYYRKKRKRRRNIFDASSKNDANKLKLIEMCILTKKKLINHHPTEQPLSNNNKCIRFAPFYLLFSTVRWRHELLVHSDLSIWLKIQTQTHFCSIESCLLNLFISPQFCSNC